MTNSRLSPQQRKAIDARRAPWMHAWERLRERHFPDADFDTLEYIAILARHAIKHGDSLGNHVVTVENPESVVVSVQPFTNGKKILVVMNPKTGVPRTVLP